MLALRFLGRGFTRSAAGKALQAWRALTGALPALERDRILEKLGEKERKRLMEKGIPRVPSTRLKAPGQLLEDVGYTGFSQATSTALSLHDYQYHGPDPEAELSKYRSRKEAARDIVLLVEALTGYVEPGLRQKLEAMGRWTREHGEALQRLQQMLQGGS
ncbi:PaREP1 family protein [Pyrodictium abyssi]|uniref:PaREP1 family protein n=1 Tax=Pyrodictium abyssi TaxID=54256 RepID=A0ABN6ZPV1_9CREN|nr:PaREP1 family protein [Pyrodictium abyssi]